MSQYSLQIHEQVREFLDQLDEKSTRVCKDNIKKLAAEPYPGRGKGDKEKIVVDGEQVYRLHVSRSFTAFYVIDDESDEVRVLELLPIDEAHDRYGH